jgi:hypothetical protein
MNMTTWDAARLGFILAAVLAVIGIGIAWLPLTVHRGGVPILPRLVMGAGILAVVFFGFDVGAMLGAGAAILGAIASWDTRPPADTPRPNRTQIIVTAAVTGLGVCAALAGWIPLVNRTEVLRLMTALIVGFLGTLGTLALADHERNKLRHLATTAGPAIPMAGEDDPRSSR